VRAEEAEEAESRRCVQRNLAEEKSLVFLRLEGRLQSLCAIIFSVAPAEAVRSVADTIAQVQPDQ
jgi:hypothetical protein